MNISIGEMESRNRIVVELYNEGTFVECTVIINFKGIYYIIAGYMLI